MSQTKSCRGVSRVLDKLEESVRSGRYYEAHQKYRTLYFRYLSQKRFDECLELLYDGAQKLLENDQYSSGADLGLLVVDTLEKTTIDDIELWIHRLGNLLAKIPSNLVERETLLVSKIDIKTGKQSKMRGSEEKCFVEKFRGKMFGS
ncbi:Golgi to ER traffic protein 4 homolog [Contarinia nasturtii]|uniref:Golgi to ER traffic protein 4 homolog n=1 Tax=Contarinia nasturtii TaxID=265458 RepID=UPI0012D455B8|nr:Golgi to ER traffic protein 4 homolog [Contarinia nasturtii]